MSAMQKMMARRRAIKLSYAQRGRKFEAFAIPKRAVRAFIKRPRKDYRKWKDYDDERLEAMMAALPVRPPIWSRLRKLQKVCLLIGAKTGRFFFMNDMGTGKTLLIIALVRYFRRLGTCRRALILVPNRINKEEWAAEMRKHAPRSTFLILPESIKDKWAALENSDTLFVFATYADVINMICRGSKAGAARKGKYKPSQHLMEKLAKRFDLIAGDESTAAKNPKKLPFRILRAMGKRMRYVFMMTGTPFNRDPADIWAQMFLVDRGYTLGESFGLFRAAFYTAQKGQWTAWDYSFDKSKDELLHTMLANGSIAYQADDASLPRVSRIKKEVTLPDDAEAYFEEAKRVMRESRGNYVEQKNAFLRMRQISSGFLGFKHDDTGETARFEFPTNPKLELLLSTVQNINPEHQYIIFFDFTYSGLRIKRELKELGIPITLLHGKTKDVAKARDDFRKGKTQGLLLQNQFGIGLNIQVAKYGLFYESPVSAITRKQCERRVERQGSSHAKVQLWDFIAKDTMDQNILDFHKEGGDLFKALVRGEFTL